MESLDILKSISNPTKLRLVSLLLENELCVCELEEITGIRQANISKNLLSLKNLTIVDVRREAQRGFYFLTEEFLSNTHFINHLYDIKASEPQLQEDHKRFLHHEETKDGKIYVCRAYRNEANKQ
jgi:ArsR family transcriptional regulator